MPTLRPMYLADLRKVLEIIKSHDEDDAEAAESGYEIEGCDNQYVYELDEEVIGVTGFQPVEATDRSSWLSWTYLSKTHIGKGFGRAMLLDLLEKLKELNTRMLFVKVSDYVDPEHGAIYGKALQLYLSIGFKEELINKGFYDENENQIILAMDLGSEIGSELGEFEKIQEEKPIIRFNGIYEIAETDGAYSFSWEVHNTKRFFSKRNFTESDLGIGLRAAKTAGARKVFITFPSNLPLIHNPLHSIGFKFCGKLSNYYEEGVHDMHFVHDLVEG